MWAFSTSDESLSASILGIPCYFSAGRHRRKVSSVDPEANNLPSGENATEKTHPVCFVKICICLPVSTFHRRIVRSLDPEARSLPSGENATELTSFICSPCNSVPLSIGFSPVHKVVRFPNVPVVHSIVGCLNRGSFHLGQVDPEANSLPSGENANASQLYSHSKYVLLSL